MSLMCDNGVKKSKKRCTEKGDGKGANEEDSEASLWNDGYVVKVHNIHGGKDRN